MSIHICELSTLGTENWLGAGDAPISIARERLREEARLHAKQHGCAEVEIRDSDGEVLERFAVDA